MQVKLKLHAIQHKRQNTNIKMNWQHKITKWNRTSKISQWPPQCPQFHYGLIQYTPWKFISQTLKFHASALPEKMILRLHTFPANRYEKYLTVTSLHQNTHEVPKMNEMHRMKVNMTQVRNEWVKWKYNDFPRKKNYYLDTTSLRVTTTRHSNTDPHGRHDSNTTRRTSGAK